MRRVDNHEKYGGKHPGVSAKPPKTSATTGSKITSKVKMGNRISCQVSSNDSVGQFVLAPRYRRASDSRLLDSMRS